MYSSIINFECSVSFTIDESKNSIASLPFPVLTSSNEKISESISAVKELVEFTLVISPLPRSSDISPISVVKAANTI